MNLRVDWASHEAVKFACLNWHYSKSVPAGKTVKIGSWENGKFVGAIVYSRGATPHIASPFGLTQNDVCELTRVAFGMHRTPISKSLALSIRFLRKHCPGVRLIVSFSDADQNHHGGIYQATNWLYAGISNAGQRGAFVVHGKKIHPRSIGAMGGIQSIEWIRKHMDPNATEFITVGKHKYLFPLDDEIRTMIEPLRKPYPKRASSVVCDTSGVQPEMGGAIPTGALQPNK